MDIYDKVKFIRESSNCNQKQFAEILEVTQSTISKYEKKERTPDFHVIKNLFDKFDINLNWLFFDKESPFLNKDSNNVSMFNRELVEDIDMILTPEEFNQKLNEIIFDYTIDKIANDGNDNEKSPIRKFLEAIKLEGHIPFRPLLFLYYIFRYVRDNKDEIAHVANFKTYLISLVERYNVLSFKNNPAFTSQIKREFIASIQEHLKEEDCRRLLINNEVVIDRIEKKMTSTIVVAHKKIDTKTLFPRK